MNCWAIHLESLSYLQNAYEDTMSEEEQFSRQKIAKGRRVFNEGDAGDYAYIVETGEIGIFKKIDGSEVELTSLQPGEIFGEVAVLDGRERMASAIALMDTSLIVVSQQALQDRIDKSDKFVKTLLQVFMTNLRDTHKTYRNPKHNFEGHIKSINRHMNSLKDLSKMTEMDDFIEEVGPVLVDMKRKCDKLYDISKKYREKAKG
jgi:CRP/FNR family cyclic AMP-dependent transcriptional regulator